MMRVVRRISFVILLAIMGVMTGDAMALPQSTFGEENGWTGYKYYEDEETGFDLVIQWSVYDIGAYPTEFDWAGAVDMPAGDRYIYAYQIRSNPYTADTSQDIASFRVLDAGGDEIAQSVMHSTTAQRDGTGSDVMPDPNVSVVQGMWEWSAAIRFLPAGNYSSVLIYSSDRPPTRGTFAVQAASEPNEPPVPEIPEPSTVALLGAASALAAARRRSRRLRG